MITNLGGGSLRATTTKTFSFTLVLADVSEITADIAAALFEAGCDDATSGSCEGIVSVDFDREAHSLGVAIGSAVSDVERAGYGITRIDIDPRRATGGP